MRLQYKIMSYFSVIIMLIIGLISMLFYRHINVTLESQMGLSAMDIAITVSSLDEVKEGLYEEVPYEEMQQFIEGFRNNTRYQYIIVMDMEGIQYAYPYQSGVGKPYKNEGEDRVLEKGESYISADRNELVSAIRAFTPVYYDGKQVGAVVVGLLTDQVHKETEANRKSLEITLVFGLIIGIVVSFFLAMNIKKSIFGLEPKEIGLLLSEKELIFNSITRSIIVIELDGKILTYNDTARELLNLTEDVVGQPIIKYDKELGNQLAKMIETKECIRDYQLMIRGELHVLVSACFMKDPNQEDVGIVVNLEEMDQARKLAEELTDYKGMVDSLRAQNHEFMNKLHTLSGLIQLEAYGEAIDYIDNLSSISQRLQHLIMDHIKDQKVAGLVLAKYNKITEGKIDFNIHPDSVVSGLPDRITSESLCSIIGNLLDNSYEALLDQENGYIEMLINSNSDYCEIMVKNNGPMIVSDYKNQIFERHYTTKETGKPSIGNKRGVGLYLIHEIVQSAGGTITWTNDKGVIWNVQIPKRK